MKLTIDNGDKRITWDNHTDDIMLKPFIKAFFQAMIAYGNNRATLLKSLQEFIDEENKKLLEEVKTERMDTWNQALKKANGKVEKACEIFDEMWIEK